MVHLALSILLGTYLYSPLSDVAIADVVVQAVVFPALALSGLLMWKGPVLRRRIRTRGAEAEH